MAVALAGFAGVVVAFRSRSVHEWSKIDRVVGEHGGAIKIKLRAPPVEGKANAALISFLADRLKIPAQTVVLLRGQKSRDKLVRIDGLSEEDVRRRLL